MGHEFQKNFWFSKFAAIFFPPKLLHPGFGGFDTLIGLVVGSPFKWSFYLLSLKWETWLDDQDVLQCSPVYSRCFAGVHSTFHSWGLPVHKWRRLLVQEPGPNIWRKKGNRKKADNSQPQNSLKTAEYLVQFCRPSLALEMSKVRKLEVWLLGFDFGPMAKGVACTCFTSKPWRKGSLSM